MEPFLEILPPAAMGELAGMPWLPAALLGVGLAASSGLRTFLPLLLICIAGRYQLFGVQLSETFAWLTSDMALLALCIATVVEALADKVPVVDHALDVVGTFSRPLAGGLAAASVWNTQDPAVAALVGLVVGAPLAFGFHSIKASTRGASTVTSAGLANPAVSFVEDIAALFLGLVSMFAPWLVPALLGFVLVMLWIVYRLARRYVGQGRVARSRSGF